MSRYLITFYVPETGECPTTTRKFISTNMAQTWAQTRAAECELDVYSIELLLGDDIRSEPTFQYGSD